MRLRLGGLLVPNHHIFLRRTLAAYQKLPVHRGSQGSFECILLSPVSTRDMLLLLEKHRETHIVKENYVVASHLRLS